MRVIRVQVGPLATNAYLVSDERSGQGCVIDPGAEGERLARLCRQGGLEPLYIINTHGHADHTGGNAALKAAFPEARLCIGAGDASMLQGGAENLSAMLGAPVAGPPPDATLHEGVELTFGAVTLKVVETPGHTPGSISLLWDGQEPAQVFCGDLIFRDGVGRTDLPGGDWRSLIASIRDRILVLPDDTVLWPGHGDRTTVGRERRDNAFLDQ